MPARPRPIEPTPDEVPALPPGAVPMNQDVPDLPPGAVPVDEGGLPAILPGMEIIPDINPEFDVQESPRIGTRIVQRFLGTDVEEDPLEMTRLGTTALGAVAGGIAGTRVPPLPGPAGLIVNPITAGLLFSGIGAGFGALAPETTLQLAEDLGVLEPGTRERLGLSPEELRTVIMGEILLDLATGGGFTAARLTGRTVARMLTGPGKEGITVAERAGEKGIHLMPVQVGARLLARGYVAVFGRFPWVGAKLRATGQAAEDALKAALQFAARRIGPLESFSDISTIIFRDAKTLVKGINDNFGKQYEALFARADELGTIVVPREILGVADDILKRLLRETPQELATVGKKVVPVEGDPGQALEIVRDFIKNEILTMRAGTVIAKQSLRQMDGLVSKIDQQIAALEPKQRRFAMTLLTQLRQAAQGDVYRNARGMNADIIIDELRALDTTFSQTISELFETSTAQRFASVQKRGLRGIEIEKATRIPIDMLARIVIKLDSPQAMEELARIVTPGTYKLIAARVIADAVQDARRFVGDLGGQFEPEVFAKRLGLDDLTSSRRKAVAEMLERAGGELKIEDLDILHDAAKAIAGMEIPNVSTFIARRVTIGGIQGLINGMIPGLAIAGGSGFAGSVGGTVLGIAMFMGGTRLVSSILARPESVRLLRSVAKQESELIFGKNGIRPSSRRAVVLMIRASLIEFQRLGEITGQQLGELFTVLQQTMDALDEQIKELRQ